MKMEIPVEAPRAGRVQEIRVGEGDAVEEGDVLALLA
jgi:biotin carboxyl carrier protein